MSTTTLFVELLIIGFQACLWLFLVVYSTIGVNAINFLDGKFSKYPTLTTALVFALAYVLGIFFDKMAKWLIEESWFGRGLQSYKARIASHHRTTRCDKNREKYAYIMVRKGQPMTDLLYARSKVRILRASIINIPMITLAAMLCMYAYLKIPPKWISISLIVTFLDGMILTILFSWLYVYNEVLHRERLELFYEVAKLENNGG
jgi:hypothetical protein